MPASAGRTSWIRQRPSTGANTSRSRCSGAAAASASYRPGGVPLLKGGRADGDGHHGPGTDAVPRSRHLGQEGRESGQHAAGFLQAGTDAFVRHGRGRRRYVDLIQQPEVARAEGQGANPRQPADRFLGVRRVKLCLHLGRNGGRIHGWSRRFLGGAPGVSARAPSQLQRPSRRSPATRGAPALRRFPTRQRGHPARPGPRPRPAIPCGQRGSGGRHPGGRHPGGRRRRRPSGQNGARRRSARLCRRRATFPARSGQAARGLRTRR